MNSPGLEILATAAFPKKKIITKKKSHMKNIRSNKYHIEVMVNGEIHRANKRLTYEQVKKATKTLDARGPWDTSVQLSLTVDGVTRSRTTIITEAESQRISESMAKNRHWTKICSK